MAPKYSEEDSGDRQIIKCFENLRTTCIRLQNSGDAPFNMMPIIGIVEQLQKTVMENDIVSTCKDSHENQLYTNMI